MDSEKKEKLHQAAEILAKEAFPGSLGAIVLVLEPEGSAGCVAIRLRGGPMVEYLLLGLAGLLKSLESWPRFRQILRKALDTPSPDVLKLFNEAYILVEKGGEDRVEFEEL